MACLRALVAAALFLLVAGTLGSSWFAVLEALQNADYVLTIPGNAPPGLAPLDVDAVAGTPSKRGGTQIEGQVNSNNRHQATIMLEDFRVSRICWRIMQVELGDGQHAEWR
jgi:hypothetical protein